MFLVPISPRARVWLALAALRSWALADTSVSDACVADEGTDDFVALQKTVQPHRHHAAPIWRDALEAEKAFFGKADAAMLETRRQQLERGMGAPKKRYHVENPQMDPQQPPHGPYQPCYMTNPPICDKDPVTGLTLYLPPPPQNEELKQMPEVHSKNGLLETTLVVSTAWIEVPGTGVRLLSRVYNGSYPGPTLRMKRGDRIKIKLINDLGPNVPDDVRFVRREGMATIKYPKGLPEDDAEYQDVGQNNKNPLRMKGKTNNFHGANNTNFHVHGFHVSPHEPQDNVLITVLPGQEYDYDYHLSPYHNAGNSWYHPHWHGAVTLQTNGGMVGAMIVEDSEGEAPCWITDAREETLLLHEVLWDYFGPRWQEFNPNDEEHGCFPFGSFYSLRCALAHRAAFIANLTGDALFRMEYAEGWGYELGETAPISSFFSVNGQYQPTTSMTTGEWVRFRYIFGSASLHINPIMFSDDPSVAASCEMYLVAKDSAWVEDRPRRITKGLFLGAGNRAQVMMRCGKAGKVMIRNNCSSGCRSYGEVNPAQAKQVFLFIDVTGKDVTFTEEPAKSKPDRPRYLQSLVDIDDSLIYDPEVPPAENIFNHAPVETKIPMKDGKTIGQEMTFGFPGMGYQGRPGSITPTASENQPVRFVIQNMTFSHERPMATFPVGEVIELNIVGAETHWWHMHTSPVQFVKFSTENPTEKWGGFNEIGDWQDVVSLPQPLDVIEAGTSARSIESVKVRFQTDCYQGVYIVHCHILYHEDLGMFTFFNATGKDHTTNPNFENEGIFKLAPEQCRVPGQQCAPKSACAPEYVYGQGQQQQQQQEQMGPPGADDH